MAMQCWADPNPMFKPAMRLIASISKGITTEITTTFAHDYSSGLYVRIKIPFACKMEQLNNYTGYITVTGTTTFTLDVDSRSFTTFIIPAVPEPIWADICAQVIPIGELNTMYSEAVHNVL